MRDFAYHIPTKIYFGNKEERYLSSELLKYGSKVLLVYGGGSIKRNGIYDRIMENMKGSDLEVVEFPGIEPNPRIESVRRGAKICREEGIDVILAVGGGSVIDAAKFIAAGRFYDGDPWDFFVKGQKVEKALPIVTMLTLSATGSEMDTGGVISNPETNEKLGAGASCLRPVASFLNPENTYTVSKFQTAAGAADIISHIMEIYFNTEEGFLMIDRFMEGLMETVITYAPIACREPENYKARAELMWAASWAINGFLQGGRRCDWSCHPMEHELSAFYDITHGLGLAIITPRWLKYSLSEKTMDRYVEFGKRVFEIDANLSNQCIAEVAIERLSDFFYHTLGLAENLSDIGIGSENFEKMAEEACAGSKDGVIRGFIDLDSADVKNIYEMCL